MLVLLALLLPGCGDPGRPARTPVTLAPGAPVAGLAGGVLDIPVGVPMGGYSSRCTYLGGSSKVDKRDTPYKVGFSPSAGVQTPSEAQVLWLENGDQDLVLARYDAIYAFDGMVEDLERRLGAATGRQLAGRVVVATSHSHHMPGPMSAQESFYLGGDRFNREIYERITGGLEALALEAWQDRVPAAIGIGTDEDWDPDDRVYHDRRGENDDYQFFDDLPTGPYKDPWLWMLRVDTADGDPLGFFFTFGMHGTTLGGDNPMLSADAPGAVTDAVRERFDRPLVIGHLQGGGGDASPGGADVGHDYARLESIGEFAADPIVDLWQRTPTTSEPITIESASRAISLERDQIRVHRPDRVLEYAPFVDDDDYAPDEQIWDEQDQIITPIDEFNVQYGAVFCGYADPLLSSGTIGTESFPYDGCMQVDLISAVLFGIFGLDVEQMTMPLPHTIAALTTSVRIGPVPILEDDGTVSEDDALLGFFPGETTSWFAEQFRRRARDETGFQHPLPVGYSQDHEGYLLLPEDWLLGGYEANINFWGPLFAEHIMEGNLRMVADLLTTDLAEPHDPTGEYAATTYAYDPLDPTGPDDTPEAGTWADTVPEELYTPLVELGLRPEVAPPAEVARVQGIAQVVWHGGDPSVDPARVVLERQEDGDWVEVTTRSGRPVSSDLGDIIVSWLPDPLYPYEKAQTHTWWAAWQAVGHSTDRAGIPEGTYRLHVHGDRYAGGSVGWPWSRESYELTSDPFEVVPATLDVSLGADGAVEASLVAPPWGFRLVSTDGSSRAANPLDGATLYWELSDGSLQVDAVEGVAAGAATTFAGSPPEDAVAAVVVDQHGNSGSAVQ